MAIGFGAGLVLRVGLGDSNVIPGLTLSGLVIGLTVGIIYALFKKAE